MYHNVKDETTELLDENIEKSLLPYSWQRFQKALTQEKENM